MSAPNPDVSPDASSDDGPDLGPEVAPPRRRRSRTWLLAGCAALLSLVCCGGAASAVVLTVISAEANKPQNQNQAQGLRCGGQTVDITAKLPSVNSLSQDQMRNAAIIVSVGQQM